MDNADEWTFLPMPELFTRASCRKGWKTISDESSLMLPPPPSPDDDPIGQETELNCLKNDVFSGFLVYYIISCTVAL